MHEVTQDRKFSRSDIMSMENLLRQQPDVHLGDSEFCPLKHSFTDGIYMREIFIPAGTALVGKIHKHAHPNILLKGKVRLVTEDGYEELEGPIALISKAGTKRALVALTDLIWITIHHNPTNTQDLNKIENFVIAKSYEEFEQFIALKESKIKLFFKPFTKLISWLG